MPSAVRVMVVDDLQDMRWALTELVRREGMEVLEAEDGATALRMVRACPPDVVVLDVHMPGLSGVDTLRELKKLRANLPVIMVTAYPALREAVAAIKAGAFDYLERPFDHGQFVRALNVALASRSVRDHPQQTDAAPVPFLAQWMGPSEKVRQLCAEVEQVARTDLTVVISGESGTGKELVAMAIHTLSPRSSKPCVVVDCGGIPESLLENELFGHERGAFTGADRTTIGKFEAAVGGTIFFDEISNLPVGLQSKLLRALETKAIFRIGSTTVREVDVRVVAATNCDLMSLVAAASFRGDLFYRLSQYEIKVPALRDRREDIIFLAHRFLERANEELERNVRGFSEAATARMLDYHWPGNVRELRNAIARAALRAVDLIEVEHLGLPGAKGSEPAIPTSFLSEAGRQLPLKEIVRRQTADLERRVLSEVLQETAGNKAQAARLLGLDYKTVRTKMQQYGIQLQRVA